MKIALDVDDVLAAFSSHAAAFHGEPLKKMDYWYYEDMDEYLGVDWFKKIAPVEEFWKTLPILNPASDIDFNVDYYISSFPVEMFQHRVDWLKKYGYPDAPLIVASNKLEKCLELGIDVLVDDKPDTMRLFLGSPIKGIHFITPYAGFEPVGDFVTSLKQVKPLLEKLKQFA
jgi:hypothetical protein